ncbi:MAG TPA: hypothetical protein VFQ85_04290 [Mycobacteriales bacterium]|nr:hypothetical protein [Mycobacteriales bacterium]
MLTPFAFDRLASARTCEDVVRASCAAPRPTFGWLLACALVGAALASGAVLVARRRQPLRREG